MALKVGDKAPDFKLFNTDKQEVSLSDFKGKPVVLLFFPQAFTGTCTKELCSVRDDISNYANLGAEVIAVSVDSLFTLKKFKEVENYNFTLLSDFNKDVSRTYDSIYEDWIHGMKGVSKRSAYVIDKDGIIRYAETMDNVSEIPNLEAVKETISKLS
jgi:glutaredoxin-dependent peroxiredoxin